MKIAHYQLKYKSNVLYLFNSFPELFPKVELKIIDDDLSSTSNDDHYKFVALKDESIVSYSALSKFYDSDYSWQIRWLVVDKKNHKQGIGALLIKRIIDEAKKLNIGKVYVETCSCDGELPARRFYEKQGFKKQAKLKDYYNRGHSKIIYLKKIKI